MATTENPRTTRVRKIVLDAATALFMEEGYRAVTPQRVSQLTGVARSTIYRHWPDQVALLLDTIDLVVHPHDSVATVGELATDLATALESLQRRLDRRPFRDIFAALLEHANRSSEIIPVQRRFVSGVVAPLHQIVVEAVDQGRLDLCVSTEEAVAQLAGPLFQQHVMLRAPITHELIVGTVEAFIAASPAHARRGRRR
jgi:AcrR family transcriptional regulator